MNEEVEILVDRFLRLPLKERDAEFPTVKEVAVLLGKDDSTIRGMVREDKLRGLKIIGRIRIHLPSVRDRLKKLNRD
jgi:excisionase family DNA binding protein